MRIANLLFYNRNFLSNAMLFYQESRNKSNHEEIVQKKRVTF